MTSKTVPLISLYLYEINVFLTGTYQKCDEVLQNTTGIIVPPDYDRNGLYDPNVDCMWIVEAPGDHVIQFHIYFVDIESSTYCSKDLLQV